MSKHCGLRKEITQDRSEASPESKPSIKIRTSVCLLNREEKRPMREDKETPTGGKQAVRAIDIHRSMNESLGGTSSKGNRGQRLLLLL